VACHQPLGSAGALRVARRFTIALVGLAAVMVSFAARVTPASADPLQNAEARAADLSEQAVSVAVVVHQMSVRFEADRAETAFLREQLDASQAAVHSFQLESRRSELLLRQEALQSYVDEVLGAGSAAPLARNLIELDAQTTYLSLAAGDISDTIDQYRLDRAELATAMGRRELALRHELTAETKAGNQRMLALREAGSLQLLIAQAQIQIRALSVPPPQTTAQTAAQTTAGLPVGNGVVKAVSQALGTAPPSSSVLMAVQAASPTTTAPTTIESATVPTTTARGPPDSTVAPPPITTTTEPLTKTTVAPVTTTTEPVTTTVAPTTTLAPAVTTTAPSAAEPPPAGGVWLELRECESGDNYQTDTGNGFYGAYQFAALTWSGLGLSGLASQAPYWVQDEAAQRLQAQYGWRPWPACSAALGL
jgi:Transglycosylase-like domain